MRRRRSRQCKTEAEARSGMQYNTMGNLPRGGNYAYAVRVMS